tara:strand:- start:130 stop:450 length:321 start_codon:yes stop_codon:yes gene_type:complete
MPDTLTPEQLESSFCEQSSYVNVKSSLSATCDLLEALLYQVEFRAENDRVEASDYLPGEQRLAEELDLAIEHLSAAATAIENNSTTKLYYGISSKPQRITATPADL